MVEERLLRETAALADIEAALVEETGERTEGKETDMWVPPWCAHGEVVAPRIPAAEQGEVQPISPMSGIRDRRDQEALRAQDASNLPDRTLWLEKMLENLNAYRNVERGVLEGQVSGILNNPRVEAAPARHPHRVLGYD